MKRQYGKYWISHTGRVFFDRWMEREFHLRISDTGYRMLGRQMFSRVIMDLFGSPRPNPKSRIIHLDGDKSNDHLSNLRWAKGPSPTRTTRRPVASYLDGIYERRFESVADLARHLGVSKPTATRIVTESRILKDGRTYRFETRSISLFS